MDQFEYIDFYKAMLALAAGLILGLERELKDKSAGLKTITIITLGSTLFAILSQKIGGPENESTRIASYIVSGIGFLGAGVIFNKDGVNVAGLTTAAVIWLSSAVGMSIGFGEIYVAAIFVASALVLIQASNIITRMFQDVKITRQLKATFSISHYQHSKVVVRDIQNFAISSERKRLYKKENVFEVHIELVLERKRLSELETFLLDNPYIVSFEL